MKTTEWMIALLVLCMISNGTVRAEEAAEASAGKAETVSWETDCSSTQGWYGNETDKGFQAKIEQAEPSVLKVTQEGAENWGKVACVLKDIDLDKAPMIKIKVNKVDPNSAFKVGVAPLDWSEFHEVVPRCSADGIQIGDIKTATGWSGKKNFNLVVIVEGKGKATWIDNIKVASKQ